MPPEVQLQLEAMAEIQHYALTGRRSEACVAALRCLAQRHGGTLNCLREDLACLAGMPRACVHALQPVMARAGLALTALGAA